jgi:non-specific serine/threonine protein kinase
MLTDASLALADGENDVARQRMADAEAIARTVSDPAIDAHVCYVSGSAVMYGGDLPGAVEIFERGLGALPPGQELPLRLDLLLSYAVAAGVLGDADRANACHEESLRITSPVGECFHRSYALWALGLFAMQQGEHDRSTELHAESLRLRRGVRDLTGIGWSLESLAWADSAFARPKRVATLLGAADQLWEIMGRPLRTYQHLYPYHEQCEHDARTQLGDHRFDKAFDRGRAMSVDEAIAFALEEQAAPVAPVESPSVLTRREREIAELIAAGLTNRQIADRLVISVRTAETHAEHILTKLGFRSRVQVATWMSEQRAEQAPD